MIKNYEKYFLTYELFFSIVIIAILYYLTFYLKLNLIIMSLLDQNRSVLYGTIASISGALLGFVITGISILFAMKESPALLLLKTSSHYKTVFIVFLSACRYLAINTVVSLFGLLIDKDSSPHIWFFFIVLWVSLISVFRLMRCIWVLEQMIKLSLSA